MSALFNDGKRLRIEMCIQKKKGGVDAVNPFLSLFGLQSSIQ